MGNRERGAAARRISGGGPRGRRLLLGGFLAMIVFAALPGHAAAAECTNSWTGPATGTWATAANWSAKTVPNGTDVACIGAGNTVEVTGASRLASVVQGEGSLVIAKEASLELTSASTPSEIGGLTMLISSTLTGAGDLRITDSLAWKNESTMSGSGSTILLPGATGTTTMELRGKLKRRFVNEGTFTTTKGWLEFFEAAVFENLGTFNANTIAAQVLNRSGTITGGFVNKGTFRRTEAGAANVEVPFENRAAVTATAGVLSFKAGGGGAGSNEWAGAGGEVAFLGGSYALESGTSLVGAIGIYKSSTKVTAQGVSASTAKLNINEEATLTIASGSMTVDTLTLSAYRGVVTGAGDLRIANSLAWKNESTMSGSGSTILLPGATATTTMELRGKLKGRRFVNEGTFTTTTGWLEFFENAVFENLGTFNADTPAAQVLNRSGATTGGFINKGTFRRTVTGAGNVEVPFDNRAAVTATAGVLAFKGDGTTAGSNTWAGAGGEVAFAAGDYVMESGTSLSGEIKMVGDTTVVAEGVAAAAASININEEATLAIPSGSMTVDTLTLSAYRGVVTGAGDLRIADSLAWKNESTMSGSGSTILLPGATATTTMELSGKLKGRRFVNEGAFTTTTGWLELSEGALFENLGTFSANTPAAEVLALGSSAGGFLNKGTFRRTEAGSVEVEVFFENRGTVTAAAGVLAFKGGGITGGSNDWGGLGGEISFTAGDYVLDAGSSLAGDIGIHKVGTEVTVFGVSAGAAKVTLNEEAKLRIPSGTLLLDTLILSEYRGEVSGAGDLKIGNQLAWRRESTMSGPGSTILLPGATATTTMELRGKLKNRRFVNEGTFTMNTGWVELFEGSVFENRGTVNANTIEEKAFVNAGTSSIVNEGMFQKTAGAATTEVEPDFSNSGVIRETSGRLKILNPKAVSSKSQMPHQPDCGDPVECATGNFAESQTDIDVGGLGVGLTLSRTYSAQAAAAASSPGAFGYGWTSSFSDRLAVSGGGESVTLTKADSSVIQFTKTGPTSYQGPPWAEGELSGSPEAGFSYTGRDQIQLNFSGAGKLQEVVDRAGNKTSLAYDGSGRLVTIEDPGGRKITLSYNSAGRVGKAEDPMGHTIEYAYSGDDLVGVTQPDEEALRWEFDYDGDHRITTMVDGRGGETINVYDAQDRVVSQTDPDGHVLTFAYAPFHTTITNVSTGSVIDQWFTSYNQPFLITRGAGTADATTEQFTYTAAGQMRSVTDGNGHTTSFTYDEDNNRISEKDAAGETKWTYNGTHDLVSMTSPGGLTTTFVRNGDGSIKSISKPGPGETTQTTTFGYTEDGQVKTITDPLNRTWTFQYDGAGNRISEEDPLGNVHTFDYDLNSHITAIVTPRGNEEGSSPAEYEYTFQRDPHGRPLKATDPLGRSTEYDYDGNGNLVARTDAEGHVTKFAYNGLNLQTQVEKPNGAILETEYDGAGDVISQTDANEETTTYVRNALGQPIEVIDPLGRKTIEEFDAAGNLVKLVDSAERETSYSYDAADRLVEIEYSDPLTADVEFAYDADDNVVEMNDGTGESTFAYDGLGRLVESENGHGDTVGYDYDLAEQLVGVEYPNGKTVTRGYDGAGRLEEVTDWLGGTTTFAYDADDNLTGIEFPAATGNEDEFDYDRIGRMTSAVFTKGPETLASLSYVRDKIGQVEDEARSGLPGAAEIAFDYDDNDRLVQAGVAGFAYDDADNLTEGFGSSFSYDAASQLDTGTGVDYTYDQLGQRVETAPSGQPATSYGYDQAGNLVSVDRPAGGETPAIAEDFAYDGTGLLASRTSGASTKHLTWDESAELPLLIADEDHSFVYGPNNLPIMQISAAEVPTYIHHDQIGSTRLLTDASGEVGARFSYGPYGALEGKTGSAATVLGFASQYTDPQTGLQYMRARFYDPATGQFLSKDPLAGVTQAPYAYAQGNPTTFVDPSGKACVEYSSFGFRYPNIIDCFAQGGEEVLESPVTGTVAGIGCLVAKVCKPIQAIVSGGLLATLSNLLRSENDPCFEFWPAQLESMVVLLASNAPGGLFQIASGKAGGSIGLTPLGERVLDFVLEAPGLLLDVVHSARN